MVKPDTLTPIERKVVRLLSLGCSTNQAATLLNLTNDAVEGHCERAMRKLGVGTRAELTRLAIQLGITSLDDHLADDERKRIGEVEGP
jgi:DNA-binding NarL/FixJ family response regulator